jgi:hypothetical protein
MPVITVGSVQLQYNISRKCHQLTAPDRIENIVWLADSKDRPSQYK